MSHCGFGALSGTQTVTFRDQASLTMRDDAVLTFGGSIPGAIEANFDSTTQTIVPYGVIVGTTAGATLNIRNGHYMRGEGNWNAIGCTYNSCPKGTLSVEDGTFTTPANLYVSALGTGTVRMGPAATARLTAKNVVLGCTSKDGEDHNSTVAFRFAKESTGTIAAAEKLTIAAGTKLVLNFSGYEQGRTVRFPLITYATREGDFDAADIEVVGEEPKGGRLLTDVACTGGRSYQYVIARGTTIIVR